MIGVKSADEAMKIIDDKGIKYIRLWFTDVLGVLKGMTITRSEIEHIFTHGQGFDGSSIEGFVRIEESDLMAHPDLSTFAVFPWPINDEKIASVFCDIKTPHGEPYVGDSRYVLRRMVDRLKAEGYTAYMGPEIEYFYFKNSSKPEPVEYGGYFEYSTVDETTRLRKGAVGALEDIGIPVECSHHEVAPSQHEIDLKYQDALRMADYAMMYRIIVKEQALAHGYYATFMPKPIFGVNGSGMHTHQSLFKDGRNAFYDASDKYRLSDIAKRYIAGILVHIKEFTLITNQWVNSYKRLVPGYEAPVYISWGRRNRSSLVRVPMYQLGRESSTRIEVRSPDPACNPYLAFAVMLAAGYEGIKKGYPLPEPVEENIFEMDSRQLKRKKIDTLPGSLMESLNFFKKSDLMRETLCDHIFETLISNKMVEWDNFRTAVTDYEIKSYLGTL
ncbi:MAG: type I glutamate--ammonia ligase [candidate division Zixibacteria bacterium RBG_16_53_22]|nr:MAG: type I glutamate--ammonia ligase [candidate division Zixibacteria bacterium RBG_16_53_22]